MWTQLVPGWAQLPADVREVAHGALSKFNEQTLRDFVQDGVKVHMRRPDPGNDRIGGTQNPLSKAVEVWLDPSNFNPEHVEAYLIHELVHSADRIRGRRAMGPLKKLATTFQDQYESRQDDRVRDMQHDYTRRSLPGLARQVADFAARNPDKLDRNLVMADRDYKVRMDAPDRLVMTEQNRFVSKYKAAGPSLGIGLMTSAIGASLCLLSPLVGLPIVAFGAKHLVSAGRALKDDAALDGYSEPGITVKGGEFQLQVPDTVTIERSTTTPYATLSMRPEEYFAESMTEYLRSESSRHNLALRDPNMHQYCQEWNLGR